MYPSHDQTKTPIQGRRKQNGRELTTTSVITISLIGGIFFPGD
jgi:hypothetical protein